MTNKELAMLGWRFEEAQKMLGTNAKGHDFIEAFEAAGISKQTEILTTISNELLALAVDKKVPHEVWTGEVEDEQEEINNKLAKAFGEEPGYHSYVTLSESANWHTDKIEIKVNWSCIGAQSPDKAVAFADALTEAANFAKTFKYNGFTEIWK